MNADVWASIQDVRHGIQGGAEARKLFVGKGVIGLLGCGEVGPYAGQGEARRRVQGPGDVRGFIRWHAEAVHAGVDLEMHAQRALPPSRLDHRVGYAARGDGDF